MVHRDIKPGNVLLDGEGRPHLSDFGIAVLADATNITATGMVIGTASYLSPEQVRGQQVGPGSDVYALGLVLLECITARREYPGNALEAAVARLHRPPEIPADLPASLGGLLEAMTRDEPVDRPTTEQVVAELRAMAREAGMDAQTVLAPAPSTGTGGMRTTAMGATGATSYAPMGATGATRRMGTPPGGYGPAAGATYGDRTAVVGAGGAGVAAADPDERTGGRGRRAALIGLLAVLLLGGGVGGYFLVSGTGSDTPVIAPTVPPALAPPPAPTTTTETTTRTTRRTTTQRTTTPPPVTQAPVVPVEPTRTTVAPVVPPARRRDHR